MMIYVSALMVYESKILLLNHRKRGKFIQPGGKMNQNLDGDSVMAALLREVDEETGIRNQTVYSNPFSPMRFWDYSAKEYDFVSWEKEREELCWAHPTIRWPSIAPIGIVSNAEVVDLFYVIGVKGSKVKINVWEHSGYVWVAPYELKSKNMDDPIVFKLAQTALYVRSLASGHAVVEENELMGISVLR